MRQLGPVVPITALPMFNAMQDLTSGLRRIAFERVLQASQKDRTLVGALLFPASFDLFAAVCRAVVQRHHDIGWLGGRAKRERWQMGIAEHS